MFQFPSVSISPPVILDTDNWPASASVYKTFSEILGEMYMLSHPWEDALRSSPGCSRTDVGAISELSDFPPAFAFYTLMSVTQICNFTVNIESPGFCF